MKKSIQAGRESQEPTGAGWRWARLILCAHLLGLGLAWVPDVWTVSQPPLVTSLLRLCCLFRSPSAQLCHPHLPLSWVVIRSPSILLGQPHCFPYPRLSPSPTVHTKRRCCLQLSSMGTGLRIPDPNTAWVACKQTDRGGHDPYPRVFSKRFLRHKA